MPLVDILPDFRDRAVALAIAERALLQEGEVVEGLEDRLPTTAVEKDGAVFYRPYAAAYRWLKANPRWLEEATGRRGAKWRSLDAALAGLAEDQAALDAMLGLTIPPHLQTDVGSATVPGPVLQPWG